MFYYYKCKDKILFSKYDYNTLQKISETEAQVSSHLIYYLYKLLPKVSRRSFIVTHPNHLYLETENIDLLKIPSSILVELPEWLHGKIKQRLIIAVNTNYPNWEEVLSKTLPKSYSINIVGLGDVGGTLLMGLRLMGGNKINSIGIYDKDKNKVKRWEFEGNQIYSPGYEDSFPNINCINEDEIFNCDIFVFCVSVGVPEIGSDVKDVRLVQYEGNSKIINYYAKAARELGFKGTFAVISDPVDLLCKSAFLCSNKDKNGDFDFKGLAPEQIKGFGLGVMNARASYYAKIIPELKHYLNEGRAFGPHGEGLIIADSIKNYNEELSAILTGKTKAANLELRASGFKPYIAPALSSGSLSLLAYIKNQWHYSASFIGGTFMGSMNRYISGETELEMLDLPDKLFSKLQHTYSYLGSFFNE